MYAFSEMLDPVALFRKFPPPFVGISPGMGGVGGCESFSAHLRNEKMATEEYLAHHFLVSSGF